MLQIKNFMLIIEGILFYCILSVGYYHMAINWRFCYYLQCVKFDIHIFDLYIYRLCVTTHE